MEDLDGLLERAAAADGMTRIDYRDPIAAFGPSAVERLRPWLLDARLGSFAVLTIARAGELHDAKVEALAALRAARDRCPDAVRPQLEDALVRLGGRALRARQAVRAPAAPRPSAPSRVAALPAAVTLVVGEWVAAERPAQPAREWHRNQWVTSFPRQTHLLRSLPARIDRAAIRPRCLDAASSPEAAERSLVATMAWGAIDFGYRCKWTAEMLATPRAGERLQAAAQTLAAEGPAAAYRRLHHTGDCHIERLGEAFASKWLYFCQPDGQPLRALILDSYVNDWLKANAGLSFSSGRGSEQGYASYLASMHAWAAELGLTAEDVELCIFRAEATVRGSGWGD